MAILFFVLIALVLLAGFLALTEYEIRRGRRFFSLERARLDEATARATFILTHVDFAELVRSETQHFAQRAGHDAAFLSLRLVRAIERFLTRLVRYLRMQRNAPAASRESSRTFVRTLSHFKEHLRATRPEMPEVP